MAKKILPTLTTNTQWQWCIRENATYLDCPTSEYANSTNIMIAAFNPSADPSDYLSLPVQHGFYKVMTYNYASQQFQPAANAAVFSENETLANGYTVNNPWLHIDYAIDGHQLGLVQLIYDPTNNLEVKGQSDDVVFFQNQFDDLRLNGYDPLRGHNFTFKNKNYANYFNFFVDLRYWPAFCNSDQQNSGAYIFRIENGTGESIRYSQFQGLVYWKSNFVNQITFFYQNEKNESARIMMRMFGKRQVTEWTLKLGSIPNVTDSSSGKEVIIQFQTPQITNNKTFYTDSNGLEMQQRILDYRPTWNFSTFLNVTQNYYPVDSAIAIRDPLNGNQMTLMTTRSHGGSSIMEGQIELMHHRRLYCDDGRGVGEPLNETDVYGNGMRVSTTYYLHLFNTKNETSQQRPWQMHIDDPVQYYYNFGFNLTSQTGTQFMRLPNTVTLQSVGFPTETGKLNIVGQAQNLLLVRLTNYADKFDNSTGGPVPYVNIRSIATALYQ